VELLAVDDVGLFAAERRLPLLLVTMRRTLDPTS
jgi:hypothetical protein